MNPCGVVLQFVFERPPPASSETTSTFPSGVTSAWCDVVIPSLFGITATVLTRPSSTRETSTTKVDLIAATYIVLPSRENCTSCGCQRPLALEPFGPVMTTQV